MFPKQLQNQLRDFDSRLALLLATTLDIQPYQLQHFNGTTKIFSLLGAQKLLTEFQQINTRTFSEQLKFYILGAFVDQGAIKLDKIYNKEEVQIIEFQEKRKNEKQQDEQEQRQESNKDRYKKQQNEIGSQIEKKPISYFEMIESLQCQYYREVITFERVQQSFQKNIEYSRHQYLTPKQLGFILLNKLDKKSHGFLYLKDLLNFIAKIDGGVIYKNIRSQLKKDKNHETPYLSTLKNKLCNNTHTDASSYKPAKLLKTHINEYPIHIQNIIELFYRISQQPKSLTYKLVQNVLKTQEEKNKEKEEKKQHEIQLYQKSKAKRQVFMSEMMDIRRTAQKLLNRNREISSLSEQRKDTNIQTNHQQPIYLNTHRHQPKYIDPHPDTFRKQNNYTSLSNDHTSLKLYTPTNQVNKKPLLSSNPISTNVKENKQWVQIKPFSVRPSKQLIHERVMIELDKIAALKAQNRRTLYKLLEL